jgi:hypothetical protein
MNGTCFFCSTFNSSCNWDSVFFNSINKLSKFLAFCKADSTIDGEKVKYGTILTVIEGVHAYDMKNICFCLLDNQTLASCCLYKSARYDRTSAKEARIIIIEL